MKKLLLILLVLAVLLSAYPATAWLDGFDYREVHYILGNSSWGESQTNYPIELTIYRSTGTNSGNSVYVDTNCQADYDDLRFTDSSDNNMDYCIRSYSSSYANVVVEYPSLTTGNNTLYMYYGNNTATSVADSNEVFPLFDHFYGSSLNSTTWSSYTSSGGYIWVGGSTATISSVASITSTTKFAPNYTVEWASSMNNKATKTLGFESNSYIDADSNLIYRFVPYGGDVYYDTSSHTYKIKRQYAGGIYYYKLYTDGVLTNSESSGSGTTSGLSVKFYNGLGWSSRTYIDYVLVYKDNYYTTVHGVWSSEESIGSADFEANVTYGDIDQCVLFTDLSDASATNWYWDFGDGNTSTDQNPENTYGYAGAFDVSLIATFYGYNVTETKTGYINIGQSPVASFTTNKAEGTAPLAVLFTDTSTNGPTAWNWSFGDTQYSEDQNPSHSFASRGNYTVTLNASSSYGYNLTSANITVYSEMGNTTGAGIQYPPHTVQFQIKDRHGQPVSGALVTVVPVETTMGSWNWLYSLLGINYEETPLDTQEMSGTTGADGVVAFLMIEQAQYDVTVTKTGITTNNFSLYPKDEIYIITVYTTELPATPVPMSEAITWDLNAYYLNDTYVYLNFTWTDLGSTPADTILWTVEDNNATVVSTYLAFDGYNTSASYSTELGNDDATYTYGFKAYHPTYGWFNQTKSIVSHKQVTLPIPEVYRNFVGYGFVALCALIFSRRNWKQGLVVTCMFAIVLAQFGLFRVVDSYAGTMGILSVLTILSILTYMRGAGDRR